MENRVSTQLTYENLMLHRNKGELLGIMTDDFSNEHFEVYTAPCILLSSTKHGKTYEEGLNIKGGALGGYYFRALSSCSDFDSDLLFPKDGYDIAFRVYSNDTIKGLSLGLSYDGAIVFQRRDLEQGIFDLFDTIKEKSRSGIIKELTSEELSKVQRLIVEDINTGKYTRKAIKRGMDLDALHGL